MATTTVMVVMPDETVYDPLVPLQPGQWIEWREVDLKTAHPDLKWASWEECVDAMSDAESWSATLLLGGIWRDLMDKAESGESLTTSEKIYLVEKPTGMSLAGAIDIGLAAASGIEFTAVDNSGTNNIVSISEADSASSPSTASSRSGVRSDSPQAGSPLPHRHCRPDSHALPRRSPPQPFLRSNDLLAFDDLTNYNLTI